MTTSPKIDISAIMKKNVSKKIDLTTDKEKEKNKIKTEESEESEKIIKNSNENEKQNNEKLKESIDNSEEIIILENISEKIIPEDKNTNSEIKKENTNIKISLGTIKTNKEENKLQEDIKVESEIIINKKDIEDINSKINKKVDEETDKKFNKNKIAEEKNEHGEIFGNYQSDFEKKETTIIEKIKEKKKILKEKLKAPKTRILFISSLIILTAISISGLFILDPKNHSLEKYKVNILANVKIFKKTYIDKPWIQETITIEGFNFNIVSQEKGKNKKNYKYKGIIYTSETEFFVVLNSEVKEKEIEEEKNKIIDEEKEIERKIIEKKKIIRNVLLDKFNKK